MRGLLSVTLSGTEKENEGLNTFFLIWFALSVYFASLLQRDRQLRNQNDVCVCASTNMEEQQAYDREHFWTPEKMNDEFKSHTNNVSQS